MSNMDTAQFKQGQRESWDSVAAEWQKWWKTTEAAAKRPPCTNDLYMLDKPVLRSGKNISPNLQSTASNVEVGKSIVSVSPSLNSITSCKPREAALCLAMDNICDEMSVASI